MNKKNIFYAQSGGVTSVINASACAVIKTAKKYKKFGKVYAGLHGILGALNEELIDTSLEPIANIEALKYTPGGTFGSCRYKLKDYETNTKEYDRLLDVFAAHNIGYFLYNGGNDSQDTVNKVAQISLKKGFPIQCIGIPKTIDNDIPLTDTCPGFGSVAKYVAISIMEAGLDIYSMYSTSTKVFILEVMGRHAGWIAASAGLASHDKSMSPHIILFPEITFDENIFLAKVRESIKKYGFCTIVASEGIKDKQNQFLSAGSQDSFGHFQLGGVAPKLAQLIKNKLGQKCHWAVSDYLQRSARHIASKTDVSQAYALGEAAVRMLAAGKNGLMPVIIRKKSSPYKWSIGEVPINKVANLERKLPTNFISKDGFRITSKCKEYLEPLIQGEDYPKYHKGLPKYIILKNKLVKKKLHHFSFD